MNKGFTLIELLIIIAIIGILASVLIPQCSKKNNGDQQYRTSCPTCNRPY